MNIISILANLALVIVLFFLSAWFAGIETALTSVNPLQLSAMRKRNAKNIEYILKLEREIEKTLVTILIGNNVVNIMLSAIVAILANSIFQAIGVSIVLGVLTFLIIVFGDIIPKSKAVVINEIILQNNAKKIFYLSKILTPLVKVFLILRELFLRKFNLTKIKKDFLVSEKQVKDMILLGLNEGSILELEKDLIDQVFNFTDCTTKTIMVPIKDVFTIKYGTKLKIVKNKIANKGFTRVPIINKKHQVIGLIYSKDLLYCKGKTLKSLLRPIIFVNQKDKISDVFSLMKSKKVHMVIVKNDHQKHVGIITLEDILEELVGEIYDEYSIQKYPGS
ncbi:DUF21 domain-containing protein [Candidatus Peregrinibacteria bacterium]|nr:DUF21 domain-containing protein [Candidatus Peregrinibacteria bacterium]